MEGKKNEADEGNSGRKKKGRKEVGNRGYIGRNGTTSERDKEREKEGGRETTRARKQSRSSFRFAGVLAAATRLSFVFLSPPANLLCLRPQRAAFCPFCPETFSLPLPLLLVLLLLFGSHLCLGMRKESLGDSLS